MSNILTTAATEKCSHSGQITLGPADGTLHIADAAVYTTTALSGASIACSNPTNLGGPCVVAADAGSAVLMVNGSAVLLADKLLTGPAAPAALPATVILAPSFVTTV
jgi:hypothetical protein